MLVVQCGVEANLSDPTKEAAMSRALWRTALALTGLGLATAVGAEQARPPDPPPEAALTRSKPWPAPVGHRQPRAADVTGQGPAKDDFAERLERINRSLDQTLQICQRC
jgi:hypothetical protein